MSLQDFDDAVAIIESHNTKGFFVGPRPEDLIQAAEGALGLKFPAIYRKFLARYGAGNFGGVEFYGVTNANFQSASVPNGIWLTLRIRSKASLPLNLVIIGDTGDGDYYCLESKGPEEEAPVIVYQPGYSPQEQRREVIAQDFGKFLLDKVKAEL